MCRAPICRSAYTAPMATPTERTTEAAGITQNEDRTTS